MKDTNQRYKSPGFRVKLLLLCALVAAAPAGNTGFAAGSPASSILTPVRNVDIGWLSASGTAIQTGGTTIRVDLSEHRAWNFDSSRAWSAISKSSSVTASVEGRELVLNILAAGKAEIELRAGKPGAEALVDTWMVDVSKTGDINGDGQITSADALYITKLVNSKTPLTPKEINLYDINRDGVVTLADSTALLTGYVGKSSSVAPTYIVNLLEVNDAPGIADGRLEGELKVTGTLTAQYRYYDAEEDAETAASYRWYRGRQADGSDKALIGNASGKSYRIGEADLGFYLFAEVTPRAAGGSAQGVPVTLASASFVPDTAPPELALAPSPSGALTKQQAGGELALEFNEPVKAGSGVIALYTVNHTLVKEYRADDAAHIGFSGSRVTLRNLDLQELTDYYITVESGALVDLAGNPFAGWTNANDWRLTTPDMNGPLVSSLLPLAHSKKVLPDSSLVLTFNEQVQAAAGGTVVLHRADGSVAQTLPADDASRVTVQGAVVTIKPDALEELETYYVTMAEGTFTDLAGNAAEGLTGSSDWDFTVADVTPPALTDWTPSNHAQQVLPGSDLVLTFSETVEAVSGKTITVYDMASQTAAAAIDADDAAKVTVQGNQVTVKNPGLSADKHYQVNISAGAFKDASGNGSAALDGSTDWSFAMVDTIPPQLASTLPVNGTAAAGVQEPLKMTFSEPVQTVAGKKIIIHLKDDDSAVFEMDAADSSRVAVAGTAVTLTGLQLQEKTDYYVTVEPGALTDKAGNAFAGIADNSGWHFSVPDLTAPTAASFSPVRGSAAAGRTAPLVLEFSEKVTAAVNKQIRIMRASDHTVVATYNANDPAAVQIADGVVTLANPGLADGTGYYVEVDSGAFKDEGGNVFAGLSGEGAWSFSTPDTIAPVLSGTLPAASATGVALSAALTATFNEPVQAQAGKKIIVRNLDTQAVVAEYAADDPANILVNGASVTIANPGLLELSRYGIEIEPGALTDTSGNPFAGLTEGAWSFATPDPRGFTAANTASEFSAVQMMHDGGAVLLLEITGDAFKDTLGSGDFELNNAPAGVTVMDAVYADGGSAYLMLNYDGTPFDEIVPNFSVTAKSGALQSGKPAQSPAMAVIGESGPKVVTLSPASGEAAADKRGALTVSFDKTITAGSGKNISIYRSSDDSLVQQIDAGDSSKVTVSGTAATIRPNVLADGTSYYVKMDAGAFITDRGADSSALDGKNSWTFTTAPAIPGPFFSEYLNAGDGRQALEIYSSVPNANYVGYKLVLYKYMKATNKVETTSIELNPHSWQNNMLYIMLDRNFYDAMDSTGITYFNEEFYGYDPAVFTLNALVITDASGKVIDVLGDPTATGQNPFMASGGTLVRKPGSYGGSSVFRLNQWNSYPAGTFVYLGNHTN
ncbi:Ig-like domain-containing protein [Paenibacillus glufosinatiresistens]|uniref:Ig-like domain-containing protein n=1 Tax=Paenibacillus glufosinatiresistens TaxID=3070657 RepID=UPI00286DB0E1|nr:Ig-like domain-containing protein [Paenibacillus sp. YX.27]